MLISPSPRTSSDSSALASTDCSHCQGLCRLADHCRSAPLGAKRSPRGRGCLRREAAAPGQSRWEASARSREACSAGATSISGMTPTSLSCADMRSAGRGPCNLRARTTLRAALRLQFFSVSKHKVARAEVVSGVDRSAATAPGVWSRRRSAATTRPQSFPTQKPRPQGRRRLDSQAGAAVRRRRRECCCSSPARATSTSLRTTASTRALAILLHAPGPCC
jgi:hypothetical protein